MIRGLFAPVSCWRKFPIYVCDIPMGFSGAKSIARVDVICPPQITKHFDGADLSKEMYLKDSKIPVKKKIDPKKDKWKTQAKVPKLISRCGYTRIYHIQYIASNLNLLEYIFGEFGVKATS